MALFSSKQMVTELTGSYVISGSLIVIGPIQISGSFDSSGSFTPTGHLIPSTDNLYDLGGTSKEWRNLFITGVANIDSLLADTATIGDLTENRVVISGVSGELEDDGNFTWDGITLTLVGDAQITGSVYVSNTVSASKLDGNVSTATVDGQSLTSISSSISLRITNDSGSFESRITNDSSSFENRITNNSSSFADRATTNESNFTNNSSSDAGRLTTNEIDITNLQSDSSSFSGRITINETDITNLQSDSSSFESRITTNETDITNLQSDSSSFESRITNDSSSFESRITTNETDITNLQSDSSSLEGRVTINEGDISRLQTTSSALINDYSTAQSLGTGDDVTFNNLTATTSASMAQLDVSGNARVDGILTALEIHTAYVTSSIIYESGSTKFGDSADDTHERTGSMYVTGVVSASNLQGDSGQSHISGQTLISISSSDASRITGLQNDSSSFEGRITSDSSSLEIRVTTNETNITNLQADSSSFESRITNDSSSFSSRVTTNETNITNLQADSSSFEGRVTVNETNITNLQADSSSFEGRIATNESNIINLQADSSSFEGRVTVNESNITNLQADSSSFGIRITDTEITASSLINNYSTVQSLGTGDGVTFGTISGSSIDATGIISGSGLEADTININNGGVVNSTYEAFVNGDIGATGDIVAFESSDKRLKDNIEVIPNALENLDKIRGVLFDWNDKSPEWAQKKGHDVGVIAQEIEEVLPELVVTRDNGYKAVNYKKLTAYLIQAVKELKDEVEILKNK